MSKLQGPDNSLVGFPLHRVGIPLQKNQGFPTNI